MSDDFVHLYDFAIVTVAAAVATEQSVEDVFNAMIEKQDEVTKLHRADAWKLTQAICQLLEEDFCPTLTKERQFFSPAENSYEDVDLEIRYDYLAVELQVRVFCGLMTAEQAISELSRQEASWSVDDDVDVFDGIGSMPAETANELIASIQRHFETIRKWFITGAPTA